MRTAAQPMKACIKLHDGMMSYIDQPVHTAAQPVQICIKCYDGTMSYSPQFSFPANSEGYGAGGVSRWRDSATFHVGGRHLAHYEVTSKLTDFGFHMISCRATSSHILYWLLLALYAFYDKRGRSSEQSTVLILKPLSQNFCTDL